MNSQLSLTIIEIIVLMLGAIVLGVTIHFFIYSRKTLQDNTPAAMMQVSKEAEDWKLRYFNEVEYKDKELESLRKKLAEEEENNQINEIEADETRKLNKKLQAELQALKSQPAPQPVAETPVNTGLIDQLMQAQNNLREYQEKINSILGQIDVVKESEQKQQEIIRSNEELTGQIDDLRFKLSQKEKEVLNIRQQHELTTEMTSRLENAYNEFGILQDKIQKLEQQVLVSRRQNLEYEDLKEEHYRMVQDFEEQKLKYQAAVSENQQMKADLRETEDKLREANFQRQQLQKKVSYLEDLNDDMHAVTDANKKLEGQLKRIGELESMRNLVSGERDELAKKQQKA